MNTTEEAYDWLHANARDEYSGCRRAAELFKARIAELEAEVAILQNNVESLQADNNTLCKAYDALNGEAAAIHAKHDALAARIAGGVRVIMAGHEDGMWLLTGSEIGALKQLGTKIVTVIGDKP